MIAALLLGLTPIVLPASPAPGLAAGKNGDIYLCEVSQDGKKGTLRKYALTNGVLAPKFTFQSNFGPDLEIMPTSKGLAVVDFEKDVLLALDNLGKVLWKVSAPGISGAKVDMAGNIYTWGQTGSIWKKTPASSELEPLLDKFGVEIFIPGLYDLDPAPNDGVYTLDEGGQILLISNDGMQKVIAEIPDARRVFASKLGGVVVFDDADNKHPQFLHITLQGRIQGIWEAPGSFPVLSHASRALDGRLLIAAETETGGVAYFLDPEKKAK